MKVGLFLIGAQKSGTSSLADQIGRHPGVCFSARKEPHFFSRYGDYWRDRLEAYHALFDREPGQVCAEASTSYTFLPRFPGTADRIHEYNPDARFVYIMREPVDRIVSHYLHRLVRGRTSGPIEREVFADPVYLDRTRYATQLEPYLERFGANRVLPLVFEEFVTDPRGAVRRLADFIGIDREGFPAPRVVHASSGRTYFASGRLRRAARSGPLRSAVRRVPAPLLRGLRRVALRRVDELPRLPPESAARIRAALRGEVERVEAILGRPVGAWRRE